MAVKKIIDFQFPHELKNKINLEIHDEPLALQQILTDCEVAMKYAIKTGDNSNIFLTKFSIGHLKWFIFKSSSEEFQPDITGC